MADPYDNQAAGFDAPAGGAFSITPSDGTDLPTTTRAIYVGTGGLLRVRMKWGSDVSFDNLPDGALLPIRAVRVLSPTTAGALVGLY